TSLRGQPLPTSSPTANQMLRYSGTAWQYVNDLMGNLTSSFISLSPSAQPSPVPTGQGTLYFDEASKTLQFSDGLGPVASFRKVLTSGDTITVGSIATTGGITTSGVLSAGSVSIAGGGTSYLGPITSSGLISGAAMSATTLSASSLSVTGSSNLGSISASAIQASSVSVSGAMSSSSLNLRRDPANDWYLRASPVGANRLEFIDGGIANSPRMVIDTSGKVGIGTGSPNASLHLVSSVPEQIIVDSYGVAPGFIGRRANGSESSPTAVLNGDKLFRIGGRSYVGSGFSTGSPASIRSQATENHSSSALGSALIFSTTSNSTADDLERMRIDHSGNVGIGTTSPAYLLDLQQTRSGAGTFERIFNDSTSVGSSAGIQLATGTASSFLNLQNFDGPTPYGSVASSLGDTGGLVLMTQANAPIIFQTNGGNERMRVSGSGNVGVGHSSPTERLVVGGAIRVNGQASATNNGGVYLDFNSGTNLGRMVVGNSSESQLSFSTNSAGATYERLRIDTSGNIGIGTTSPAHKLHVLGNGSFVDSLNGPFVNIRRDGLNEWFLKATGAGTDNFEIRASSDAAINTRLAITQAGNVGIGTTSPSTKLEVSSNEFPRLEISSTHPGNTDNVAINLVTQGVDMNGTGTKGWHVYAGGDGRSDEQRNALSFSFYNGASGSPLVTFKDSGRVGIGTMAPDHKLDVQGDIRAITPENGTGGTSVLLKGDGGLHLRRPANATTGQVNGYIDFSGSDVSRWARISYNESANRLDFSPSIPGNQVDVNVTGQVRASSLSITGIASVGTLSVSGSTSLGGAGQSLSVFGSVSLFGPSVSVSDNVEQVATSDGLVVAMLTSTGNCNTGPTRAYGQAAAGAEPLVTRAHTSAHNGCTDQDYATPLGSFTMPVRKGERYKVYSQGGSRTLTATFYPLGQ
ncbi:MAG: putative YapH protein, partial [Pseudomonadota bacterium]